MAVSSTTQFSVFLGIDISKSWFDVAIWMPTRPLLLHRQFTNDRMGFARLWKWLKKHLKMSSDQWLFCLEATGLYSRALVHFLMGKSAAVWIASALDIKRSMGLQRGKSDQIDAQRIAQYCATHQHQKRLVGLSKISLEKLQDLEAARKRLIRARKLLRTPLAELQHIDPQNARMLEKISRDSLKGIDKSIDKVEKQIAQTIEADSELNQSFQLAQSVKGVGKVLALQLILATHGFTRMMNPRKLACHAGVAPFTHQSGSSIKSPKGVSKFADNKLKATLHMAAISVCKSDPEFRQYFERKIEQGKHPMAIINAIRNKILHRVIAVVKRGYPYIQFNPQFT